MGESNIMVDAFSRQSTLLMVLSTQVIGFEELKNQYKTDSYFCKIIIDLEELVRLQTLPYRLHEGHLFKGNQLCILEGFLRE